MYISQAHEGAANIAVLFAEMHRSMHDGVVLQSIG
jgi:hypothetical protein